MKQTICLFFVLFLLTACQTNTSKDSNDITANTRQWLKPNLWIEGVKELYNFPHWFDDSLLAANQITKVQIKQFYGSDSLESLDQYPIESRTFFFDKQGQIERYVFESFRDNHLLNRKTYVYLPLKEKENYLYRSLESLVEYDFMTQSETSWKSDELNKVQYLSNLHNENVASYFSELKHQFLFQIKSEEILTPMRIDTLLNPNPQDLLIIPNLDRPTKIYNVENKIVESNVYEFNYNDQGILMSYNFLKKSNLKKRLIRYSEKGWMNGFEDFMYSNKDLISKQKFVFELDKNGAPIKIVEYLTGNKIGKVYQIRYE